MTIKDLKLKILEEAYQMIIEDGVESFSVRDLSRRLNISHNTMYRYFKTKKELIFTLVGEGFEHLANACQLIIERDDIDNVQKYKECAYVYIEFAVNNPRIYKTMFSMDILNEDLPEKYLRIYKKNYLQLMELNDNSIKSKKIKKGTKHSVTNMIWAIVHGLSVLLIDNILPYDNNMNSLPQMLKKKSKKKTNRKKKIPDFTNVHNTVKFSIETIIDALTSRDRD